MKKLSLLSMGSASLLMAGAAMAAPPSGFTYNDYTVNVGVITAGACPVGYTCQTLQNDIGFLQQRLTDGTAAGTYFRTVVVEDDASAVDPGQVDALAFRNDTFVGASNNSGAVASLAKVELIGGVGSGFTEAELARGDLNDGTEASNIRLRQFQVLDGTLPTVDFTFFENDDGSENLRIDQVASTATFSGPMTVRRTSGAFTECAEVGGVGCVLDLPDGQTITYDSGDNIQVMYQHQNLFGMALPAADRVFESQRYTNFTSAQEISWTNVNNTMETGGGGSVTFNTISDGGAWDYWDDNFGTAPTAVVPPAGFPTVPFDP